MLDRRLLAGGGRGLSAELEVGAGGVVQRERNERPAVAQRRFSVLVCNKIRKNLEKCSTRNLVSFFNHRFRIKIRSSCLHFLLRSSL